MRFLDGHKLEDRLRVPVKTAYQKLFACSWFEVELQACHQIKIFDVQCAGDDRLTCKAAPGRAGSTPLLFYSSWRPLRVDSLEAAIHDPTWMPLCVPFMS